MKSFLCSILGIFMVFVSWNSHAQYYNSIPKYLNANKNVGVYGGAYFFNILPNYDVHIWENPFGYNNIVPESNYVLSDPNSGELMFYTLTYKDVNSPIRDQFTTTFYDKDHQAIQDGAFTYTRGITEMMHIAAITPAFDNDYLFFVFYYDNSDSLMFMYDLKYALLDMRANNGKGAFIEKGTTLMHSTDKQFQRGIIPGNDCNIWALFLSEKDDMLFTFEIRGRTIDTVPKTSPVSLRMEFAEADNPIFKIAPDRQTLFMTATLTDMNTVDGVFYQELNLFRFDIDNGTLNNQLKIRTKLISSKTPFCNYEFIDHNTILLSLNIFTDTTTELYKIDITEFNADYILDHITEVKGLFPVRRFVEFKKYQDYYYMLQPKFAKMDPNTMQQVTFFGNLGGASIHDINGGGFMKSFSFNEKQEMGDFKNEPIYLNNNFLSMETIYPLPYQANFTNKVTVESHCFQNNFQRELKALRVSESYEWDNGSTDPERTINEPGTYWVRYPYKCIFLIDSFYIRDVFEYLNVKDLDTTICKQQYPLKIQYPKVVDSVIYNGKTVVDNYFYASDDANYRVELYKNGCITPANVNIQSEDCLCELFAPNAFTPNGDGLNDYFKPITLNGCVPTDYELQILNRYGERMYFSYTYDHLGWDGTQNGKLLPQGVYFFEIKFRDAYTNKSFYYKGDITLLR